MFATRKIKTPVSWAALFWRAPKKSKMTNSRGQTLSVFSSLLSSPLPHTEKVLVQKNDMNSLVFPQWL